MYIVKPEGSKVKLLRTAPEQTGTDPKVIGSITVCNLLQIEITDQDGWTPPTQAQAQALHDIFAIDVRLADKEDN